MDDKNTRLLQIATSIKNGEDPNSFESELDALLDTEMEDRDSTAEAVWEADYRGEEVLP